MAALKTEEENYVRLSLLLIGVAPRAVRDYFNQLFPPTTLSSTLTNQQVNLTDLYNKRIINQAQWNLLFPATGDTDSKTFDLSLMTCLIRNVASIPKPRNGYDKLPLASELFEAADLARIKFHRNKLAHVDIEKINQLYYNTAWKEISDAIGRLSGTALKQECHDLKFKILDQSNSELMLEIQYARTEIEQLKQSVASLQDTIPWNVREQINQKLEIWKEEENVFVETRAAKHVLTSLQANNCVTVTGSSGVGKTATVCHVALQMEKDGYELIPVTDPCNVIEYYNPNQTTLFIFDDFCGTFNINQTFLDKCKTLSKDIELILKGNKVKIIVTCRHQVYKDDRFKAIPLFQSCECDLTSKSTCLLLKERKSIATNYLDTDADKISEYIELYPFFPLLCKLYKENPSMQINVFFKSPFTVYEDEIDKLFNNAAYGKFCCLFLCVIFNNSIKEEWFTGEINIEIKTVIENILEACKISRGTPRLQIKDDLDSLIHTFLKKENGVYKTLHDKLFDFLSFYFGRLNFYVTIKNANSSFIMERFLYKRVGYSEQFKIVIPESCKKMYIKRVFNDWENGQVVNVFCNSNMKISSFFEEFKSHLYSLPISHQTQLACICDVYNNDTVLIQCCFVGDIDLVQWCCDQRSEKRSVLLVMKRSIVNKCRDNGTSPLFVACQEGHSEIVRMLIDMEADMNRCVEDGMSPSEKAYQNDHSKDANVLLERKRNINRCRDNGTSPLFVACQEGQSEIVSTLIDMEAGMNRFVYVTGQESRYWQDANVLLERKTNINKCINNGTSPLFIACENGHSEIVRILIDRKADINKCTNDGASSLFIACQVGHSKIVSVLLDRKADINKCMNNGTSPLIIACQNGHSEIVSMLLNREVDIDKCTDEGESPLFKACQEGHSTIVKVLLDRNADFNKCMNNGTSPLHVTCLIGNINIVKLLLDKCDNVNKCNADGITPLHNACWGGHADIVKMLLKRGADLNMCDRDGWSPLHIACQENHVSAVDILLKRGANYNKCTKSGKSTLDIIKSKGNEEMLSLFNKYTKSIDVKEYYCYI